MTERNRELAAVVLAAGAGRRLAPLTSERPKALCPIDGVPLVVGGVQRVARHVDGLASIAVNLHHGAEPLVAALDPGIHRSIEQPEALGTAGALGALRGWLDGRPVLVTNADAWFGPDLDLGAFVGGWDGERTRLLCVVDAARGDFGHLRYCGVALIPGTAAASFAPVPSGLYEVSWREERAAGRLDLVTTEAGFVDCGTPADYLAANLRAVAMRTGGVPAGGSAIDPSARVGDGAVIERSVVWSEAEVRPGEVLVDAIRTRTMTVLVRDVTR